MATERNDFIVQATLDIYRKLDGCKAMHASFGYLSNLIPLDSMYLEVYERNLGPMRIIAKATADQGNDPREGLEFW